jgi:hypothetical protein
MAENLSVTVAGWPLLPGVMSLTAPAAMYFFSNALLAAQAVINLAVPAGPLKLGEAVISVQVLGSNSMRAIDRADGFVCASTCCASQWHAKSKMLAARMEAIALLSGRLIVLMLWCSESLTCRVQEVMVYLYERENANPQMY